MILIDNSQLFFSSYFSHGHATGEVNDNLVRHTLLSQYARINDKYRSRFGDIVICNDADNYWRKKIYPGYKQQRKEQKEKNTNVDWKHLYETFDHVRDEIRDNLPYKSIRVHQCEADDVMYVLCKHYSPKEKMLIVSSDKDMIQLMKFKNVSIYSPKTDSIIKSISNVDEILFAHILKGDSSDNIPNVLSNTDDFLLKKIRQKPMTSKRIIEFTNNPSLIDEENLKRNRTLIDLSYIPEEQENNILDQYRKTVPVDRKNIFDYLVSKKMKLLLESVESF
jgi:5'-3' exonuclease